MPIRQGIRSKPSQPRIPPRPPTIARFSDTESRRAERRQVTSPPTVRLWFRRLCATVRCAGDRLGVPHRQRRSGRRSGLIGSFGLTVGISETGTFFAALDTFTFSILATTASA